MSLTVEKCLQAWTNSLKQMKAKADIVFFGDSLIYYGDFSSVFPNKVVCNLGLRGDTIKGMIDRVEQVSLLRPRNVFLMAGINDIANNTAIKFGVMFEELVQRIRTYLPSSEMVIFSILPVNNTFFSVSCNNNHISNCNEQINRIASDNCVIYIDLFSIYEENGELPKPLTLDGIHLSYEGYLKWHDVLKDLLFI